jgi:hypothetical protein
MGFQMEDNSVLRRNGYVTSRNLSSRLVPVETLKPLGRESRKHPASQIRKLAESIEQFGFVLPIIIDTADRVVAGWGPAGDGSRTYYSPTSSCQGGSTGGRSPNAVASTIPGLPVIYATKARRSQNSRMTIPAKHLNEATCRTATASGVFARRAHAPCRVACTCGNHIKTISSGRDRKGRERSDGGAAGAAELSAVSGRLFHSGW